MISLVGVRSLDETLEKCIGIFGRWQARVSILAALLKFPVAWFQLGIVFLAPPTHFWCKRPSKYSNTSLEHWLNLIATNETHSHFRQSLIHGSCYMRNIQTSSGTNDSVPCMWGYEYDTTEVHSSIITEWNLVCGKEWLVDFSQATLMVGILLGNVICGMVADNYGRKMVLIGCLIMQTLGGIVSAISPNYIIFIIARFLTAFGNGGTVVISFVISMEIVGGKWRTIVPILCQIPFGIGNTIMAFIAYFIRDWRYLQLLLSVLSAVFWLYWCWLPESPRWLLVTSRKKRAIEVLEKAAAENKLPTNEIKDIVEKVPSRSSMLTEKRPSMAALFKTPILRKKTLLLCFQWLITGISFYGFSQYLGSISTHIYLVVIVIGIISLPGTVACCFLVQKFGRKRTIIMALFLTSLCYFGILFLVVSQAGADYLKISLAAIGFVGMSISVPALYLFTGELFPTVTRNAGVGLAVMCSRIGGILAPIINLLVDRIQGLPLLVLGVLVLVNILLVVPLPETKNTTLPDTLNDAEGFLGSQYPDYKTEFKTDASKEETN